MSVYVNLCTVSICLSSKLLCSLLMYANVVFQFADYVSLFTFSVNLHQVTFMYYFHPCTTSINLCTICQSMSMSAKLSTEFVGICESVCLQTICGKSINQSIRYYQSIMKMGIVCQFMLINVKVVCQFAVFLSMSLSEHSL